jgi:hypothetical protein
VNPASERPRREHALAVLILPIVMLALVFAGVIALDQTAPTRVPAPEMVVESLPAPVLGGEPTRCLRGTSDDRVPQVRGQIVEGSRVTSALVNACPAAFEDLELTYVGEVVGHFLERDGGGWVQVNDDDYALRSGPLPTHDAFAGTNSYLAVWLPAEFAVELTGFGSANRRGDVVELVGTVVRTDPADGGGLTFRARDMRILAPSVAFTRPIHVPQAIAAAVLSAVAITVGLGLRRSRRRAR